MKSMNKRSYHEQKHAELNITKRVLFSCLRLDDNNWSKFMGKTQSHTTELEYSTSHCCLLVRNSLQVLQMTVSQQHMHRLMTLLRRSKYTNGHALALAGHMVHLAPDVVIQDCTQSLEEIIYEYGKDDSHCKQLRWWFVLQTIVRFGGHIHTQKLYDFLLYSFDCESSFGVSAYHMAILEKLDPSKGIQYANFLRCCLIHDHVKSTHDREMGIAYLAYRYLETPEGFAASLQTFCPSLSDQSAAKHVPKDLLMLLIEVYKHYNDARVLCLVSQLYARYNGYKLPHTDLPLLTLIWSLDPILMVCHTGFFLLYVQNVVATHNTEQQVIKQLITESYTALQAITDTEGYIVLHNAFDRNADRFNHLLRAYYDVQFHTVVSNVASNDQSRKHCDMHRAATSTGEPSRRVANNTRPHTVVCSDKGNKRDF